MADTHFGHAKIIDYCDRPFSSVEEMDEEMILAWNRKVPPGARVFHCGDLSFLSAGRTVRLLRRLHGTKFLVIGNHGEKRLAKDEEVRREFAWCKERYQFKGGTRLFLSHFPHISWPGSHCGSQHAHGHSHGSIPNSPGRVDVGVDTTKDYAPISYEELQERFACHCHHEGKPCG